MSPLTRILFIAAPTVPLVLGLVAFQHFAPTTTCDKARHEVFKVKTFIWSLVVIEIGWSVLAYRLLGGAE